MYLKTLNLGDIHPYERNPRINDKAVEPVMKSIEKDGYRARIIVDKDGVIIAGHTRYEAMKRLGWTEAEVWIADDMTPEQIADYRIRDNLTADFAEWDFSELEAQIAEMDLDFDMSEFGMNDGDVPNLLDAMQEDFGIAGAAKAMGTVTLTFDSPEDAEEVKSYIRKNEQAGVILAVLNYVRGYDA
jgi:site-specific DNA-methyltransferase (adenine-specific)